jgi:hypothetical protein
MITVNNSELKLPTSVFMYHWMQEAVCSSSEVYHSSLIRSLALNGSPFFLLH